MKTKFFLIVIILVSLVHTSCENITDPTLEDFCAIVPNDWDCEIIKDDFSKNDIPKNAENPVVILKYKNLNREFTRYVDTKVNPSLTLDIYSIRQKKELIDFIKSQQLYSWCIPSYYGETKDYFILTSPCFINGGCFTDEANACINDLHAALDKIIDKKEYNFNGD